MGLFNDDMDNGLQQHMLMNDGKYLHSQDVGNRLPHGKIDIKVNEITGEMFYEMADHSKSI